VDVSAHVNWLLDDDFDLKSLLQAKADREKNGKRR